MIATIAVLIIIVLSVAHFYLKATMLTAFATVFAALLSVMLAFNFYEPLADLLISRGRALQWAQAGTFTLIFVFAFALIRTACDYLIGANIDFGVIPTRVTVVVSGIIFGMVISGVLLIAVGLTPLSPKWPYARFAGQTINASSIKPAGLLINSDGFVASLFGWISKGSMSSKKSFAVYHADFVDQIHLNGLKTEDGVFITASADAVKIPPKGVRVMSDNRTVIRMGIIGRDIEDGGAKDADGSVSFTLSQIRLICKEKSQPGTTGSGIVVYPTKVIINKTPGQTDPDLSEVITISRTDFKKGAAWLDIAFQVPKGKTAVLLEFKNNTVIELPKTVTSTEEIETQLNAG